MIAAAWRRTFRRPLPVQAAWLVMPSAVVTLAIAAKPIPPHDYWWHLAFGRYIATTGSIPDRNLFLYTLPADAPFHDLPWLAQWLMYQLYAVAGHHGNAIALAVLVLGAWLVVVDTGLRRSRDVRAVAVVASLGALLATPTLMARTQMFAFPLYALSLFVTFGVVDGWLRPRALWLLVPVTALWANVHGSFVLAPALLLLVGGAHLLERRLRGRPAPRAELATWAGAGAAALLAPLASPVGLGNYPYLLSISGVTNVTEWLPPDPRNAEGATIWAAIALSAIVLAVRWRRARLADLALLLPVTYLVASATRSLFWWAAALPVVLPPLLERRGEEPRLDPGWPTANLAAVTLLSAVVLLVQPGLLLEPLRSRGLPDVRRSGEGAGLLSVDTPIELGDRLRELARTGRVFHEQRVAGWVELVLTEPARPEPVAFVDQRMELVPESVWDEYFRISHAEDWQRLLERRGVTVLLVHEHAQRRLSQAVAGSSHWRLVERQGSFLLFVRGDATR